MVDRSPRMIDSSLDNPLGVAGVAKYYGTPNISADGPVVARNKLGSKN